MKDIEKYTIEAIYKRRSVRRFVEGRQVEDSKIDQLLKAAMAAPSACNIQPWEFIVVTEASLVKEIKASIKKFGDYNAPLVMVVCSYPGFIPWENDIGATDCAAAIENMLVAATAMDLGSVWVGGFDSASLRRILDIPEDTHPVGVVYFGYPAENPAPRTQYTPDAVHWQKYDKNRERKKRAGSIV